MNYPKHNLLIGLLCMATGMSLIPVGDAIARHISSVSSYSSGFLAWSRFALGMLFIIPLALTTTRPTQLRPGFTVKQITRGILLGCTLVFIIKAVTLSPLADVFGAFFIGPVLTIILSAVLLRETPTTLEWCSVLLGFAGVLLVVQPGFSFSAGMLWALLAGLFYGSFLTATRWAASSGPPVAQLAAQLVVGFLFLLPAGLSGLLQHGFVAGIPIILMAATSAAANYLSIIGLSHAPAAFLAPVIYLQIVGATLIGLFYFKDPINAITISGLVLILLTGLMRIPAALTRMRTPMH